MNGGLRWLMSMFFCLSLISPAGAEQYRSKLYLDKSQRLGKSAELSLEELERQFDSLADSYSQSSAGRHLARNFVQQKQYDKAAAFYEKALRAKGLSDIANQEMLSELALVYVLQRNYAKAVATFRKLDNSGRSAEPQTLLLMAQAQAGMADYVGMSKTLDNLLPKMSRLDEGQLKLLAGLYYKGGNNRRSEQVLRHLLKVNSRSPEYWQQLTAILLAQNKRQQAMDQLELARQKNIPFRSQDVVLLSDLYAANGAAEKAARVLAQGISGGEVKNNFSNNKRLFEFWLQAREKDKATEALEKALRLSHNAGLYLQLAQLQMEQNNWAGMRRSVLAACSRTLPDKYVSRANLLLGVSQLKLGNSESARRAFINATLISGEVEKAQQWLAFINAAQPTAEELELISKPCAPQLARVRAAAVSAAQQVAEEDGSGEKGLGEKGLGEEGQAASSVEGTDGNLPTKTVPTQGFFTVKLSQGEIDDLSSTMRRNATALGIALVKGGGSVDGSLTLLIEGGDKAGASYRLGLPYRGQPNARGRFRLLKPGEFHCLFRTYDGPGSGVADAVKRFAEEASSAGYALNGERRLVINSGGSADQVSMEMQLGIQSR